MSGLTLDTAKTVALVAAAALVILAIVSAILLKTIAQKLAVASILALLALLVWTQRSSLQTCADLVRETGGVVTTTCTFLGQDVDIPARPGS
jgi:hypothetical protein